MKLITAIMIVAVGFILIAGCTEAPSGTDQPIPIETPTVVDTTETPIPTMQAQSENDTMSEADYCLNSGDFTSQRCINVRNKLQKTSDDSRAILQCMQDGGDYDICARGTSLDPELYKNV